MKQKTKPPRGGKNFFLETPREVREDIYSSISLESYSDMFQLSKEISLEFGKLIGGVRTLRKIVDQIHWSSTQLQVSRGQLHPTGGPLSWE